jgi:hypothetical protein
MLFGAQRTLSDRRFSAARRMRVQRPETQYDRRPHTAKKFVWEANFEHHF